MNKSHFLTRKQLDQAITDFNNQKPLLIYSDFGSVFLDGFISQCSLRNFENVVFGKRTVA